MPKKVQEFSKSLLIDPIIINIGAAGSINKDVIQEVEYVKQEQKMVFLLQCINKTPPPIIIFCEKTSDVDDVNEYLLLKGLEVVSLHGQKSQTERGKAMKLFQEGLQDVMVATDIAAKGLDFSDIKHVINFDMPKDIESYIHRLGRTGRQGKTGHATTMVNKNQDMNILSDLKFLLMECQQKIPAFLKNVVTDVEGDEACQFCGGKGHRMANCNKIERIKMRAITGAVNTKYTVKEELKDFLPPSMVAEGANQ